MTLADLVFLEETGQAHMTAIAAIGAHFATTAIRWFFNIILNRYCYLGISKDTSNHSSIGCGHSSFLTFRTSKLALSWFTRL